MNIGILGTGKIAVRMAQTLSKMSDADSYAVASRKIEKAKIFAEEHGFQKFFGSYEELVSDPKVDIIYVATPHSHHFEHAKLAIEHGKHVLCEKAFTMNAVQAEELLDFAEKKGVCITEAIWTRYMPSRKIIDSLLEEKVIGEVRTMTANLCHPLWQNERVSQPELAGGAFAGYGNLSVEFCTDALWK